MNFNLHRTVNKTQYFLEFLVAPKSSKLVDDISNQFQTMFFSIIGSVKSEKINVKLYRKISIKTI